MSILINVSLMHLRKKRVRQSVSLDEAWEEGSSWIDSLEDRRESSEAHLLKAEEYELFRAGLDCLQPELREVLLERLKETPVKEIACRRGISEAAAKSRLMRARRALKGSLLPQKTGSLLSADRTAERTSLAE